MNARTSGLYTSYSDVWVVDGIRTAFAEYNGVLGDVSPIDLGIKVAREVFRKSGLPPEMMGIALLVENPESTKH